MSDRRNRNSIVFLTTLGVYLGLVLVGATPQVLAQAALTRDFDIRNEIVFEDDLDKKPDDESSIIPRTASSDVESRIVLALLEEAIAGLGSTDELLNGFDLAEERRLLTPEFDLSASHAELFARTKTKLKDSNELSRFLSAAGPGIDALLGTRLYTPAGETESPGVTAFTPSQVFTVSILPRASIDAQLA